MQNIKRLLQKSVCSLVAASMAALPGWALGSETNMGAIGREAQSFVKELNAERVVSRRCS